MEDRRTAVVTGATGFLGRALVETLASGAWRVRATGRRAHPEWIPPGVRYHPADLIDGDMPPELLDGATHLFHLAGASSSRSSQEEMDRVNVAGTRTVMRAALSAGLDRVVHVSTTAVYGEAEPLPQPVPETAEPRPSRGYGLAKLRAEQEAWAAAEGGLPVVVVRPVTVYGPRNIKLVASAILDAAIERRAGRKRLAVPAAPIELRLMHVDDFVDACIHLATVTVPLARAYNLASGLYPSSLELAALVADALGLELEPTDEPEPGLSYEERRQAHQAMLDDGMTSDILLTPERLRFLRKTNRNNRLSLEALAETGFTPRVTDLGRSLRDTVEWYRAHRWIV